MLQAILSAPPTCPHLWGAGCQAHPVFSPLQGPCEENITITLCGPQRQGDYGLFSAPGAIYELCDLGFLHHFSEKQIPCL